MLRIEVDKIIFLTKVVQDVSDEDKLAGVELDHGHIRKKLGTLCVCVCEREREYVSVCVHACV